MMIMTFSPGTPIKDQNYAFTWDEITKLINLAKATDERDYMLFLTLAFTGRRIGEIVGADSRNRNNPDIVGMLVKDIDRHNNMIQFTIEKKFKAGKDGEKARVIRIKEIHPFLIAELVRYIESRKLGWNDKVFSIGERRVNQLVHKYCLALGIKKQRLTHAFRHGFCINWVKNAKTANDLLALKDNQEHSNFGITEGYLRFGETNARRMLRKMKPPV